MIMNLIFRKVDEEIIVLFRNGTAEDTFSYVELIRYLISGKKLGETEFEEGISEDEKSSVNLMIDEINSIVSDVIEQSR